MHYRPKVIRGRVHDTGWPIDGHTLYFGLWSYDPTSWHLYGWDDADDKVVMETLFKSAEEDGFGVYDTLEEFTEAYKAEDGLDGVFALDFDKVEVLEVISEEEKRE